MSATNSAAFANGWKAQWGQFKLPLLREELVSDGKQLAADRSIPNALFTQGYSQGIQLGYDATVPRYKGTLAVAPLDIHYSDYDPQPFTMNLGLTLERNRIAIDSGKLATSQTSVDFSGALQDLTAPHAALQYTARSTLAARQTTNAPLPSSITSSSKPSTLRV